MADTTAHGTGIEWTHVPGYKGETWNPVRGCVKISPGCKHCYAETFAERWRGVADHPYGLPRIDILRTIPAAIRFLSVEPLLEDLGPLDLSGIHWVIVGGESGLGARPLEASWVLSILAQCAAQGVPFFFKQWGGINKKLRGNFLEGKQYLEFPKIVRAA